MLSSVFRQKKDDKESEEPDYNEDKNKASLLKTAIEESKRESWLYPWYAFASQ
jgi:hypothetical protein